MALAHALEAVEAVAPAATPINPPPVAIVTAPVDSGAVASMSVEPVPFVDENVPSIKL